MKWTQSDEELQSFLSRTNNLYPSIKFTYEIYNTTSTLLVLYWKVNNPQIYTPNLPTLIKTFLSSRCHPPRVTKSISYSQALRFRRICSDDKSLKKRLGQLKNHLKRRGYQQSIMKKSLNKAHSNSRGSLFQYKEKQRCKRTH